MTRRQELKLYCIEHVVTCLNGFSIGDMVRKSKELKLKIKNEHIEFGELMNYLCMVIILDDLDIDDTGFINMCLSNHFDYDTVAYIEGILKKNMVSFEFNDGDLAINDKEFITDFNYSAIDQLKGVNIVKILYVELQDRIKDKEVKDKCQAYLRTLIKQ